MGIRTGPAPGTAREGKGYPKSLETRERIVKAALGVFGEHGYARASTREISARAQVVPPALQYHFNGKDGLHRACGEAVISEMLQTLGEPLDLAIAAADGDDAANAAESLCALLDAVILATNGPALPASMSQFFSFAQIDSAQPAFAAVREKILVPIYAASLQLVAKATGFSDDDPEARAIALLLIGQARTLSVQRQQGVTFASDNFDEATWLAAIRRALRRIVLGTIADPSWIKTP